MQIVPEHRIEQALGKLSEAGAGSFDVGQLVDELGLTDPEERAFWSNRLARELAGSGEWFHLPGEDRFVSRELFFRDREFLIVPSAREIEEGILMIGHRVAPFVSDEVFATEIDLSTDGGKRRFEWIVTRVPLNEVLPLYMLLGAEELFDCLIADHAENRWALQGADDNDGSTEVKVSAVDLADFYREHEFEAGDALAVRIADYATGVLQVEYLSGLDRSNRALTEWKRDFAAALDRVIDLFGDALNVPDQLSYCFFVGGAGLLTRNGASLDEFYAGNREFEIDFDRSGTSCLVRVDDVLFDEDEAEAGGDGAETDGEDGVAVPDGFSISSGTVASLEAILREQGIALSVTEIDAFIYDQLSRGIADFGDFLSRAFGHVKRDFADEAQEAVFDTLVEERFEELSERYDREGDLAKKDLRAEILELVEARLELAEALEAREIAPEAVPAEFREAGAEARAYFDQVLRLLNSPGFIPEEPEIRALGEAVEERAQAFEAAADKLRDQLSI